MVLPHEWYSGHVQLTRLCICYGPALLLKCNIIMCTVCELVLFSVCPLLTSIFEEFVDVWVAINTSLKEALVWVEVWRIECSLVHDWVPSDFPLRSLQALVNTECTASTECV